MATTIKNLDDFRALNPFFRIIEKGLKGIADGGHFFDLLAENVIFDYIITVPGYPRRVKGRKAVAGLYRPYGTMIVLDRCHDLACLGEMERVKADVQNSPKTPVPPGTAALPLGTPIALQASSNVIPAGFHSLALGMCG